MNIDPFSKLFSDALRANHMESLLNDDIVNKFERLTVHMLQTNAFMNITRITELSDIIQRHYLDSLTLLPHLPLGATVLDVGCGGGFPCLPLAIARPDLKITALDSTDKKVKYVQETAELLGLHHFQAITARAEDAASPSSPLRESFDVVTSRAVARLPILVELCLPFVKPGGTLIAMKGARAAQELAEAENGYRALGASAPTLLPCPLLAAEPSALPADDHVLILARKERKSPEIYPRKYAQILKKPL